MKKRPPPSKPARNEIVLLMTKNQSAVLKKHLKSVREQVDSEIDNRGFDKSPLGKILLAL